jgi:hypothetical protein
MHSTDSDPALQVTKVKAPAATTTSNTMNTKDKTRTTVFVVHTDILRSTVPGRHNGPSSSIVGQHRGGMGHFGAFRVPARSNHLLLCCRKRKKKKGQRTKKKSKNQKIFLPFLFAKKNNTTKKKPQPPNTVAF